METISLESLQNCYSKKECIDNLVTIKLLKTLTHSRYLFPIQQYVCRLVCRALK